MRSRLVGRWAGIAVTAVLAITTLAGPAVADPLMNPMAFRDRYIAELKAAHPDYNVKVISNSRIDVTPPGKEVTSQYMDNSYAEYRSDPTQLDTILSTRIRALDEAVNLESKLFDRHDLVVLVRERAFLNGVVDSQIANGAHRTAADYSVQRPLGGEIVGVLAINQPNTFMYPPLRELKKSFGEPNEPLWREALANTRRLCGQLAIGDLGDGVFLVGCDNGLSASAILDPEVWARPELAGKGEVVVGLAKFGVLVAHSGDAASIGALKKRIADLAAGPSLLSDTLLVRTRTGWTQFKAAP